MFHCWVKHILDISFKPSRLKGHFLHSLHVSLLGETHSWYFIQTFYWKDISYIIFMFHCWVKHILDISFKPIERTFLTLSSCFTVGWNTFLISHSNLLLKGHLKGHFLHYLHVSLLGETHSWYFIQTFYWKDISYIIFMFHCWVKHILDISFKPSIERTLFAFSSCFTVGWSTFLIYFIQTFYWKDTSYIIFMFHSWVKHILDISFKPSIERTLLTLSSCFTVGWNTFLIFHSNLLLKGHFLHFLHVSLLGEAHSWYFIQTFYWKDTSCILFMFHCWVKNILDISFKPSIERILLAFASCFTVGWSTFFLIFHSNLLLKGQFLHYLHVSLLGEAHSWYFIQTFYWKDSSYIIFMFHCWVKHFLDISFKPSIERTLLALSSCFTVGWSTFLIFHSNLLLKGHFLHSLHVSLLGETHSWYFIQTFYWKDTSCILFMFHCWVKHILDISFKPSIERTLLAFSSCFTVGWNTFLIFHSNLLLKGHFLHFHHVSLLCETHSFSRSL